MGRSRILVAHEGLLSSAKQMAVERTFLQNVLGLGDNFVQGIALLYQDSNGPLRAGVAFTDGMGSQNTNFTNMVGVDQRTGNFGIAGRVDYKAFGDWKFYDDFTALGNKQDLLVLAQALTGRRTATPT